MASLSWSDVERTTNELPQSTPKNSPQLVRRSLMPLTAEALTTALNCALLTINMDALNMNTWLTSPTQTPAKTPAHPPANPPRPMRAARQRPTQQPTQKN